MPTQTTSEKSVLSTLIQDYAIYNHWANSTIMDWLKTKKMNLMETEVPSSFSSVKKTLLHIWQTEQFWLKILQQEELDEVKVSTLDTPDVFVAITEHSKKMVDYVKTLNDDSLTGKVKINTPWFSSIQPRYELFQHCFNHSTYHRGQVITIGRNLDWTDVPMTDFNYFLLMVKPNV